MTRRATAAFALLLSPFILAACSGPEARQARYLERGEKFIAEKNYDKARVEISNALQINPNNVQARLAAARIAEKQQKPADAVGNYQAAIELDKDNVEARAALGRIFLMAGLPDKARQAIEPVMDKAPRDSRLLVVRGGIKAGEGDATGALADAEAATAADPKNEVALALLAAQYARQNRPEDAIAALRKGLELLPESVDLRLILAELENRSGHKAEAEEQLKIIADRHRTTLASWQQLARFYLLDKNVGSAEQALRDAVKYNPESIAAKSALVTLIATQKGAEPAQAQMLEFVKAEPKRAEMKIALGQFYEASRKPELAEATYREVIGAEGMSNRGLEARTRLAALLVRKNDAAGAEKVIKEVLAENPRDNDALILRAGIALARGQTSSAVTDLRAVLRDQPNSQPLMRALAGAHLQDGNLSLAEEVLRNAVQLDPSDQASRFDLVSLLAQSRREKQALPMAEGLVKEAPDNVGYREAIFRLQLATADMVAAKATAEEVKRLRPDLEQGYLLSGALREQARDWRGAIGEYEIAMQKTQRPDAVLTALVRVDMSERQWGRASERLAKFLSANPKDVMAHQLLGEVRLAATDPTAALASFEAAIALNPQWWVPYRGKAMAQDGAKRPDLALKALEDGLARTGAPELGVQLAERLDQQGQHDAAIAAYEQVMRRVPKSLPIANNLALALVNRRTDAASLDRAEQLASLLANSEEAPFLDTRGWIKFRRGDLDSALPLLRQAAEKSPKSAEIQYHLGMALYRSGDMVAARQSLEAALAMKVSFTGLNEARATLTALQTRG